MWKIIQYTLTIGIILSRQTFGAPLKIQQVSADAKWLAHIDIDAIRASTVAQKAWANINEKHPDVEAKLGIARAMIGMDPVKDMHGITFYGRTIGKPDATLIIAASMNRQRIVDLAELIPGRESSSHGSYVIHSWKHMHRGHTMTVATAFRDQEHLVIASSLEDLKTALDILDDKAPGLKAGSELGGNIPAGTTFLFRADGIASANLKCKVPVVHQVDSFRMVMGESEGQSFVRARITMTSSEVANTSLTVIHGWQALVNLFCPDELGRKFANAVQSKADNKTVTILWSASANDVWDSIQRIKQEVEKHIARHHAHGKRGCPFCLSCCKGGNCPLCNKANNKDGKAPEKKAVPPEEDF